jgi:hypothetical protein
MKVRELQNYLLRWDADDDVAITIDDEDLKIDSISHNGTDTVLILAGDTLD